MSDKVNLHTVKFHDRIYIRQDDVANYIEEIAATEDTDTRNRLYEAAKILKELK